MALDISLELPRIIGRCRTESNIFRHDILYFYKTTNDISSPDESSRDEMEEIIINKYNSSMKDYNNPQYHTDSCIINLFKDSHELNGFKKSYLTVKKGN